MRGYGGKLRTASNRPAPQSPSVPKSIPAPVGGWNARDPLAAMGALDAVVMDNFYPSTAKVDLRMGRSSWATGMVGNAKTLLSYQSGTASKLFCATVTNIYDVTSSGAVGAAVATSTDGKWEYRNMTTSGGSYMTLVNGVDKMKLYTGAAWVVIDGASVPALTGVTTSDLSNVHLHKRRLWFIQKQTLTAWYLAVDSIAGAATAFPMGPVFRRGGYLVAQESWSVDGGSGIDDYLVSITSEGELSIYQGADPGSATDWFLVGVYDIGRPIGKRCFRKYGGDLLCLTDRGLFPLSKQLMSATIDRTVAISDKIQGAYQTAAASYGSVFGWNITIHPIYNAIIVNVPQVEASLSFQFVMNNITKAWCRFTNWSADVFGIFGTALYSAQGTKVYLNWSGTTDLGVPIQGSVQQAYFKVSDYQCQIALTRPNLLLEGAATIRTSFDTDFNLFTSVPAESYFSYVGSQSLWDTGVWDTATWSVGQTPTSQAWFSLANSPGIFHSFRLQCAASGGSVGWISTDHVFEAAGVL